MWVLEGRPTDLLDPGRVVALVKIAPAGEPDAVLAALRPDTGTAFVTDHLPERT